VQRHFLPRLLRHGLTPENLEQLMVANPAAALRAYSTQETS
jgi:predicted metal-dependent phosphotriesterase family hydrolase